MYTDRSSRLYSVSQQLNASVTDVGPNHANLYHTTILARPPLPVQHTAVHYYVPSIELNTCIYVYMSRMKFIVRCHGSDTCDQGVSTSTIPELARKTDDSEKKKKKNRTKINSSDVWACPRAPWSTKKALYTGSSRRVHDRGSTFGVTGF